MINRKKLNEQLAAEREIYARTHKNSLAARTERSKTLLYNAPMNWMQQWPMEYPITLLSGNKHMITDVDGNQYIDFCLGYSAAFPGHGINEVTDALHNAMKAGMVYTTPSTLDAETGKLLKERFGQEFWGFSVSATDANRFVIKLCREITDRKKILVFNGCYHGTIDETIVSREEGKTIKREGSIGTGIDTAEMTTAIEFNDINALRRELAKEEYACLLMEPVMTNCGIIQPIDGYLEKTKMLCRRYGTVFVVDEAHTITAGYSGYSMEHELNPDVLILGKCIGGGFPVGAYGVNYKIKRRIDDVLKIEYSDTSGIGGTMTGSVMAMTGINAALAYGLTAENFGKANINTDMIVDGINGVIHKRKLGWSVSRIGARFDIWFSDTPAVNAAQAFRNHDKALYEYLFTALINRGYVLSPYWNILASVSPYLSLEECKGFIDAFEEVTENL